MAFAGSQRSHLRGLSSKRMTSAVTDIDNIFVFVFFSCYMHFVHFSQARFVRNQMLLIEYELVQHLGTVSMCVHTKPNCKPNIYGSP